MIAAVVLGGYATIDLYVILVVISIVRKFEDESDAVIQLSLKAPDRR